MALQHATTGPHIHSRDTIERTMGYLIISLTPALVAAVWLFGWYALYLTLATAAASAWLEIPFVRHKYSLYRPFGDGSAFVAGMILGLSLSPATAWWVPLLGAALLVIVGKQIFGGLGNNIFNPALVARAILLLSWPDQITKWISPVDGATSATPLAGLETDYLSLLLGNIPGSLGETSVIALLLGGIFLLAKGLITWRVPLAVLSGAAGAALLFGEDPLFTLLSGSIMFGAIFMATDMVTSPTGKTSHILYGIGCGILTVVIRIFTVFPAGLTFAFLIMNGVAYLMDRLGADPIFGQVELRKRRVFRALTISGAAVGMALILGLGVMGRSLIAENYTEAQLGASVRNAYPHADRVVSMKTYDPAVDYYRIYQERTLLGFIARVTTNGYGGPMAVETVLDTSKGVQQVRIGDHNETPTLGTRVRNGQFLAQYSGFDQDSRHKLHETVDIISGATISSRAVTNAVEQILAALEDPGRPAAELPDVDDGVYEGRARGYQGPIQVRVTVTRGQVNAIEVVSHTETDGIGTNAMESLKNQVIESQSLAVDAVSGATGTSRGFLSAIGDALGAD